MTPTIGMLLGLANFVGILTGIGGALWANRGKVKPAVEDAAAAIRGLTDGDITMADVKNFIAAGEKLLELYTSLKQASPVPQPVALAPPPATLAQAFEAPFAIPGLDKIVADAAAKLAETHIITRRAPQSVIST